jgi:hypothetical protein
MKDKEKGRQWKGTEKRHEHELQTGRKYRYTISRKGRKGKMNEKRQKTTTRKNEGRKHMTGKERNRQKDYDGNVLKI